MKKVFQINPYEVSNSLNILIDVCKLGSLSLYPGSWGTPMWITIPEKEDDKEVIKTLLTEAGFTIEEVNFSWVQNSPFWQY